MNRPIAFTLAALLIALPGIAAALGPLWDAAAQPLILPGARLPVENEGLSRAPFDPPGRAPSPSRPTTRPTPAKNPTEDAILNRDLRLNGAAGSLRIERAGKTDLRARIALAGTRPSRAGEACAIRPEAAVPVVSRGRVEGLLRYEIQVPGCPITAELLDGALWVRSGEMCTVQESDCRSDPRGLWGPEPGQLAAQARTIETDRGQADRAVREAYKALAGRVQPQEVRAIVSEQAAFSSDREMACRSYARESTHGFCNARYTEARASQLASRLGPSGPAAKPPARRIPPPPPLPVLD